jgi:amino acid transporter
MLGSLIASIASGELADAVRRVRSAAVAYVLAAVAAICGVAFLVGAAFSAAAQAYGTVNAALGFGAGFLVLALLILLIHRIGARRQKKEAERRRSQEMRTVAEVAALIVIPALIARGGVGGLAAPLLALLGYGIYRENRPRRRKGRRRRQQEEEGNRG